MGRVVGGSPNKVGVNVYVPLWAYEIGQNILESELWLDQPSPGHL